MSKILEGLKGRILPFKVLADNEYNNYNNARLKLLLKYACCYKNETKAQQTNPGPIISLLAQGAHTYIYTRGSTQS